LIAVAGFAQNELSITHEPNMLVVNGVKWDKEVA
jgi:HSP20 family molecular chaperone IbpA